MKGYNGERQGGKGYNVGSIHTSFHTQLRKNLPSGHIASLRYRTERSPGKKAPREDGDILKVQLPGPEGYRRNRKGAGLERLTGPGQIVGVPAALLPEVQRPPGVWPLWAIYMRPINKLEETMVKKMGRGAQKPQGQQPTRKVGVQEDQNPGPHSQALQTLMPSAGSSLGPEMASKARGRGAEEARESRKESLPGKVQLSQGPCPLQVAPAHPAIAFSALVLT